MALRETFKPGLFNIGLTIENKVSNKDLLITYKQLSYHGKLKPRQVEPAIYNLQAVLLFHMDSGRTKARLMLEELITKYPQDLNILADLIHIYKQMGREKDSNSYKEKLEELKGNKLLQARSILAQANAINYDLTAEFYRAPKVLLEDICWQLTFEDKHLQQIDKAIDIVEDAYEVVKTIPSKAFDKTRNAKEISIEKYEKGIKMLQELDCSEEEILIWKHNLANARSKLEIIRFKRDESPDCRIENCIKALKAHKDVIEKLSRNEESLKRYVARSYIFFAQFYMSRKDWFDKIVPLEIKKMSQNLDSMWREALSLCPNDQTVLQRSGRYEVNRKEFLSGIKHYNYSIKLVPDPDINWFSYSSRSDAYYYYFLSQLKNKQCDKAHIYKYLELAYKDMKQSIQSRCTDVCMMKMAQISFRMAKPYRSGISFDCQNIEYIYEALEIIHEAFNKRGLTNYGKIHYDLGNNYSYIGEYRKAIESLKTVLELNEWSQKCYKSFSLLCKCFVAFYKRVNNPNLLPEFRYLLKEAKNKDLHEWVTDAMDLMRQYNPKMLTVLIRNMIEWDVRGCDKLIDEALYFMYDPKSDYARLCENLGWMFETKLRRRNSGESNINGPNEIQKSERTENFKYDFYVSHSKKDKDWVNCMLLPQLEEFDDEIKFKGFIPSRDFVPGRQIIDSMLEGIKQSCKLLIVLTPNYLTDNWQKYVRDQMIFSVIETKVREKTIIPIILESCEIPTEIQNFTPISFIRKSDWQCLRSGLTVNMNPNMRQEEKMAAMNISNIDEDLSNEIELDSD